MDSHLLEHDALGHGRPTEGVRLHVRHRVGLVPLLLGLGGACTGGGEGSVVRTGTWGVGEDAGGERASGATSDSHMRAQARLPRKTQTKSTRTESNRLESNRLDGGTDLAGPLLVTAVHPELAPRARP